MKIVVYLFVGLVCVVGPGLLLIAAVTGVERALFLHSAATAEGAIIALRETQSAGSKSFFPIFQFKAANGMSYTVTSNIAERPTSWRLGGPVRVLDRCANRTPPALVPVVVAVQPVFVLPVVKGAGHCLARFGLARCATARLEDRNVGTGLHDQLTERHVGIAAGKLAVGRE